MKKSSVLLGLMVIMTPLAGSLPGCTGADNPKVAEAPPPPPPKPDELKTPKIGAEKAEYGANTKYQKAMERLNKPQ